MEKHDDRVTLMMSEDWFNQLIELLETVKTYCLMKLEDPDAEYKEDFLKILNDNKKIIDRILRFGQYREDPVYKKEVIIDFFSSEARDLIWQLLIHNVWFIDNVFEPLAGPSNYEIFKTQHEALKKGELVLPEILSRSAARELFGLWSVGYEYLVMNKDGICYAVDHGCSGIPVKKEDRWEDPVYGFDLNIFRRTNRNFRIVSWDDDTPLEIENYLKSNSWISWRNGEYAFIG